MKTVKNPTDDHQPGAQGSESTTSATSGPMKTVNYQTHDHQQAAQGAPVPSEPRGIFFGWISQFTKGGPKSTTSATPGPMGRDKNQTDPQGSRDTPSEPRGQKVHPPNQTDRHLNFGRSKMKYRMVVSGKTLDSHQQLMDQLKITFQGNELQLEECNQDFQIVFVFCPIASRVATDVTAAMDDVKGAGDKPIILVLMHHSYEPRYVTHLRTWDEYTNVVLHLNVFFHESRGFLTCQENATAVSEIRAKLLQIHSHNSTSADAQDKSSMTGSYPGGGDNSDFCF
ncbi:uncharacterized protein LOC103371168 [Stegastes partitus]|uniref:Uncharacterized protein LOC103371168 n=1 Tax=Stegastes partitus TaxID=144197 RepID=A0A9Y4TQK7_9TELE|nr:PREDICTED: uncharacterized protein LOC103371168 [Stegastes partitus]